MATIRTLRRLCIAGAYLIAGTTLIVFAILTVLGNVTRINVETAVVGVPVEQLVASGSGLIGELKVRPGMRVAAGEVLFRVDSETSDRQVYVARQELARAEIAWRQAQSRSEHEQRKLRVYRDISNDQLAIAQANIAALTAARDESRVEFERYSRLLESGLVSRQLYDQHKAVLDEREARVARAVAEQRISATSAQTTHAGFFFSGNFLVGDLQSAVADETAARERVTVARAVLDDALGASAGEDARRVVRTPFDAVIMRVLKSAGMTVNRGDPLVVLRHANHEPHIDAYLTQREAGQLEARSRGLAVITARGRSYPVEVVSVDGTAASLTDPTPWISRVSQDRPAYARLAFIDLSDEDRADIEPGLPVTVSIPKKLTFATTLLRTVHAASRVPPRRSPVDVQPHAEFYKSAAAAHERALADARVSQPGTNRDRKRL